MTLQDIKSQLGVQSLGFKRALDLEGDATEWYNTFVSTPQRVRLSVHEDVMEAIKADRNVSSLALKDMGTGETERGSYQKLIIVIYDDVDEVL